MTLYGFSRQDIAKHLSEFAKRDLVVNYPEMPTSVGGLGDFKSGHQAARDPEIYMFRADDGIPAATVVAITESGDVKVECTNALCKIYKPIIRDPAQAGQLDQDVNVERLKTVDDGAALASYGTATYRVYNTHTDDIPSNTMSLCVVVGGQLFALPPQKTQKRIRFRLKTNFNDTGYATAYVLDQWGCGGLTLNQVVNVCDPRKLFAHAIGADTLTSIHNANPNNTDFLHAGGSVGYAVMTYDIDPPDECDNCQTPDSSCEPANCYPRWEVEQCTQIANKMRVQIDALNGTGKITGELTEGVKQLKFNPSNAFISHWPYVDYPPEIIVPTEGSDYKINVHNPHKFTALDGWAIIERVAFSSRLENAANRCVPYFAGQTEADEWHIVDVEKPIARWVCASFNGSSGSWTYLSSQEGFDPNFPNYFAPEGSTVDQHILTHECLEIDCLENGQKGVGYWDPNSQDYQIISTNSALYGKAVDIEAIAQKVGDPPPETELLAYDGCDLKYQEMSPFKVFGANLQCPADQAEKVITPILVPVNVVSDVDRAYACTVDGTVDPTIQTESECNSAGGTWALSNDLCFTYSTVYVCNTTPSGEDPECINICCDEPLGCCEYPPGTYTPNVAQSDCNGTWTAGDCPTDECIPCDFCDFGGLQYQFDGISWDANVQSGFAGRALLNTAVWTAGAGDCDATLTVDFETDEPGIANVTATASVTLTSASSIPSCFGGLELNLSWSPSTVFGVTLPTVMGQGMPSGCAGQYGLNNCGVLPTNPDSSGNWNNIADITITDCTV